MSARDLNTRRHFATANRQREERNLATKRPTPKRITIALDLMNLYGPEVDIACGVVEPAVDMWEAGTLVPTPEQVRALSALTGFPINFFYLPEPEPLGPIWVCGDDGCEVIDQRLDAPVIQLIPRERAAQETLF